MARASLDHLADVLEAIEKIREYTRGGRARFRRSSLVRDAVQARLMQIGQAVKDAQDEGLDLPASAPSIEWRGIAGMRDRLAHKNWDADPDVVWSVIENQLEKLERAVKAILTEKGRAAPAKSGPARRGTGGRRTR
jgi:uncharacterized protein with HEPN domain